MGKSNTNLYVPPVSNTGALNTSGSGSRSLVDWVSFTLHSVYDVHDVVDILGLDFASFRECPNGDKGYMEQIRFGDISILYNGRPDMGIHVNLSGQGCRQFETYSNMDWSTFFALLLNFKVNFSRLDLAIDDFTGTLKVPTIKRKLRDGLVRSKFRTAREMRKTYIKDGSSKGDTVYFGSPESRIQVRFYDKLLERLEEGFEVEEGIKSWVRAELQMRDERASAAAYIIAFEHQSVGSLIKGLLSNYINFLKKDDDKNKARWSLADFWKKFLDNTEKLSLSQQAPDKTIQRTYNWLENQVNPSLALLYEAFNKDINMLYELIHDGLGRLDKTHLDIINRFRKEQGQNILTFTQFKHTINKDLQRIRKRQYKESLLQIEKESSWHEDSQQKEI